MYDMYAVSDGSHRGVVRRHEGVRAPLHVGASVAALARAATSAASTT